MASFAREIFAVLDADGIPLKNLVASTSITWSSIYSINSSGTATAVSSSGDKPTFTEVGGNNTTGIYVVGAGANNGAIPADTRLVGIIDCGTSAYPRYRFFDSKYEDRQSPALLSDVSILADGTNGLAAIKTQTVSTGTTATNTYNIVNNGTYGNSALNTTLGTISGYVNGGSGSAYALLTNATYGLSATKTALDSAATTGTNTYNIVNSGTYGNSAIKTAVDTASTAAVAARKVATNKWVVASNQLIIYDDNGSSALYTFNLYDANGTPTSTDIVRRVPA